MPRTKDFLLILVTIVFLLLGISSSFISQKQASSTPIESEVDIFVDSEITETRAEAVTPDEIDRESRLAQMKEKIAASGELIMAAPAEEVSEEMPEDTSEDDEVDPSLGAVSQPQFCPSYSSFVGQWPVSNINYEEVDGARVYYQLVTRPDYTSTTSDQELTEEVIRLQLPVNPVRNPVVGCIANEVVGVATDNSLIRFNEASLYSVFDESTQIGVALDGYPIYGLTDKDLDQCGGSSHTGSYAYYLSSDRDTILNCFTAQPAIFP